MSAELAVVGLERLPYEEVLELQRQLAGRRISGTLERDILLLVEHAPVITLGRGSRAESLPIPPEELERRGVDVFEVDRGGDITCHGPGQLVGYPIMYLGRPQADGRLPQVDYIEYLRRIEAVLMRTLAASRLLVNSTAINCTPWSVLKISGWPSRSACCSASRQNRPSRVLDSCQAST